MVNEPKYDLAQFIFGDTEIWVKEFTLTDDITIEKYKPCNSKYSKDATTTEHELTWECKEVHEKFYGFFEKVVETQDKSDYKPPVIKTFKYDVDGNAVHKTTFKGVYIEKLPEETATKPFDISGIALERVKALGVTASA